MRFCQASTSRQSISKSIDAPLNDVIVPTSNGGATSTRSPPTKSMPRSARNSRSASSAVMPLPRECRCPAPATGPGCRCRTSDRSGRRRRRDVPPPPRSASPCRGTPPSPARACRNGWKNPTCPDRWSFPGCRSGSPVPDPAAPPRSPVGTARRGGNATPDSRRRCRNAHRCGSCPRVAPRRPRAGSAG